MRRRIVRPRWWSPYLLSLYIAVVGAVTLYVEFGFEPAMAILQSGRTSAEQPPVSEPSKTPLYEILRAYSNQVQFAVANATSKSSGLLFTSTAFQAAGMVLRQLPQGGEVRICTGALISDHHVLTAAHCFCENADGFFSSAKECNEKGAPAKRNTHVYFPSVGLFKVSGVELYPGYQRVGASAKTSSSQNTLGDLAIVELESLVPITPIAIREMQDADHYISVGFGKSAMPQDNAERLGFPTGVYSKGIGTIAFRTLVPCAPGYSDVLCGHYSALDFSESGISSAACPGDSGGPLLGVNSRGRMNVTGVTSARQSYQGDCDPRFEARTEYTMVRPYVDWITSTMKDVWGPPLAKDRWCTDAVLSVPREGAHDLNVRPPQGHRALASLTLAGIDDAAPPIASPQDNAPCTPVLGQRDLMACQIPENGSVQISLSGAGIAQLSICDVK